MFSTVVSLGPVTGRGRPRAADGKPDPPRQDPVVARGWDLAGFERGAVGRCRVSVSWVAAGPSLSLTGLLYRLVQGAARTGTSARGANRLLRRVGDEVRVRHVRCCREFP